MTIERGIPTCYEGIITKNFIAIIVDSATNLLAKIKDGKDWQREKII